MFLAFNKAKTRGTPTSLTVVYYICHIIIPMQTITVPEKFDGQRIDNALFELMSAYSRSFVQKLIRKRLVKINDKVAKKGNRVKTGDAIFVREAKLEKSKFEANEIPLDIVYEDEDLLIVNKPPGLITHPSAHQKTYTLVNALLHHCGDSLSGIGGEKRPGIVHRLDKDTSGLLLVAKHDEAHKDLAKQIQNRQVEKRYLSLVVGLMNSKSGTIDAPLLKTRIQKKNKVVVSSSRDAKESLTHFEVKQVFSRPGSPSSPKEDFTLLKVQLVTGRTHQIRVHLSSINRPIVGDETYGNKKANAYFHKLGLTRQFLHAYRLKFKHPRSHKWMEFEAPLGEDLQSVLRQLV